MLGGTSFPPIGQLPYLLTLPPYGFYWFVLATEKALPPWHAPAPEPLPDLRTLVLKADVKELLGAAVRGDLEQNVLPEYLPKRRWFAAKGERLEGVRLSAIAALPEAKGAVVLAEVEARLPGRTERYCPAAGRRGGCRGRRPAGGAARPGAAAAGPPRRLPDRCLHRQPHAARRAARAARRAGAADATMARSASARRPRLADIALPEAPEIRRLSAEQSNSSLIFGEQVVLKIIRRINPGIHPEAEVTRYLTEQGFANTAPLLGEVVRIAPDGTPHHADAGAGLRAQPGRWLGLDADWLPARWTRRR